jgi:TP901 family phage tail tape measure protein
MADLTKTVEIIFGAVDNTGNTLSGLSSSIENTVNGISNITAPLADIAAKAELAQAALVATGAAFLSIAVNEASKFGEKIEEIGSLTNATAEQQQALKTAVQDFAISSTSGFDAIGQAMYVATSNLGDTSRALDVLKVAEAGAIVGATDLETSTALLTRTMNAYGLATDDSQTNTANAERVMAAMFTTVQNGDVTMAALSENIGKVASTAAAAGVDIETVGAAIAAITGAGVSAEQSTTLLNAAIKELLSPSKELEAALGGVKLTTDGLPAVMDKLKAVTGGSADKMYQLFGSTEAAKAALILANDSAGKFDGTLQAMTTSTAAFKNNLDNMTGGVEDSAQKLENTATVLLQKVGDPLQDTWAAILDALSNAVGGLNLAIDDGAFDAVFAAINGFGTDLTAQINTIAKNLPEALKGVDFTGALDAFGDLGREIAGLFDGVDLSTPQGLENAIQAVVDTVESLTRVTKGIVETWGPFVDALFEGVGAFNKLDDNTKEAAGNVLGISQAFETLKGIVLGGASAIDTIGKALSAIAAIKAAESVAALAGALGNPVFAAVAATLAAIGFAVKTNSDAYDDYKSRQDAVASSALNLATNQQKISERLKEISDKTGITITDMADFNKKVNEGVLVFNEANGQWEKASSGISSIGDASAAAAETGKGFAEMVNDVAASMGLASDQAKKTGTEFQNLEDAQTALWYAVKDGKNVYIDFEDGLWKIKDAAKGYGTSLDDAKNSTDAAANAAKEGSKEWKTIQDALLESEKAANEFKIKMADLALQKYEIDVRANVDLQTAQIEADTARIGSAFQATADVIASLTSGVTDLWIAFSDKAGFKGGDALAGAAKRMEDRLDQELELKRQMTQAVVDQATATANRLNSGEPIISIDARELAPELELVFDKILRYTQVKASQQGLSLLVGL